MLLVWSTALTNGSNSEERLGGEWRDGNVENVSTIRQCDESQIGRAFTGTDAAKRRWRRRRSMAGATSTCGQSSAPRSAVVVVLAHSKQVGGRFSLLPISLFGRDASATKPRRRRATATSDARRREHAETRRRCRSWWRPRRNERRDQSARRRGRNCRTPAEPPAEYVSERSARRQRSLRPTPNQPATGSDPKGSARKHRPGG